MKVTGRAKVDKVSIDVAPQKLLKKKEKELQEFIRKCPIHIEYGCHDIELEVNDRHFNGFTFYADEIDEKGRLVIRIM